ASQPPVREGVGGIEEPEEDHASASAPRLEDFAGGSSPGGDPAPREGALAEAATHADEEAVDNQDATSEDEEGYEETASDVVYVEGGGTPAGYQESASPINDGGGENQSATPRPASYGEPRSFAYGEPLPTFGPEDTEEHLHPSADAGRWKWVVIGGAGLAALALVVVAT